MSTVSYRATTSEGYCVNLDAYHFWGYSTTRERVVKSREDIASDMGLIRVLLFQDGRWYVGRIATGRRNGGGGKAVLIADPCEDFEEVDRLGAVAWFKEYFMRIPDSAAAILSKPVDAPAESGPASQPYVPSAPPSRVKVRSEDQALLVLMRLANKGEPITVASIAREVGCSPSYLYRRQRFKEAWAATANTKSALPRGRKSRDTGELEAYEEDDPGE